MNIFSSQIPDLRSIRIFIYDVKLPFIAIKIIMFGSQVAFVLASDDVDWCKSTFGDSQDIVFSVDAESHFATSHQPTFDLAVLSLCQHSIMRYHH